MAQDRNPSQSPENEENQSPDREQFESDTQRIMHRHLKNKDDIITDEDIAGIRVGMTPPEFDGAGAELMQDAVAGTEASVGELKDDDDDANEGTERLTPWDTVEGDKD